MISTRVPAKGHEGSRRRAATAKTRASAARLVRRFRTFALRTLSAHESTLSRTERRGGRCPRSPGRMSSLEPGLRGMREHLALESPRETRDATPAPATPPQNASTISRDTTSASFADLRQHIAKRGAPFTGRVRVDTSASASKPLEPSGAGGSPMKRVASTPSLQARASTPAPGSQGMRDMFFVRQDNINFNASYGTPVRECVSRIRRRPRTPAPCFPNRRSRVAVAMRPKPNTNECVYTFPLSAAAAHPRTLTRDIPPGSGEAVGVPRRVRDACTSGCSAWRRCAARGARRPRVLRERGGARRGAGGELHGGGDGDHPLGAAPRGRRGDPPQHRVRDGQERAQAPTRTRWARTC